MNSPSTSRALSAALLALASLAAGCSSYDGTCESSALCDPGTFCASGRCVAALDASPTCSPPSVPGTLLASAVVTPAARACTPTSGTPPAPVPAANTGWQIPLGAHSVGEVVSFSVPPGTASVSIHAQATSAAYSFTYAGQAIANSVVPTAVRTPNGATIYDDDVRQPLATQPYRESAYYGGFTPWTGSFTVPDTWRFFDLALASGQVPPGTWSFQVNDWNVECASVRGCTPSATAGRYDLTAIARPGPFRGTGRLDVAIYLAGGGSLTAATAAGQDGYKRFVWAIGQFLGRAGICLGTVTIFDVPAWAPSTPNIDESPPCGDLAALFSLASRNVDGVHLFLVDGFTTTMGSGIVGIDGSIPGPSGLPGAATSGAAMIMADIGAVKNLANCTTGPLDLVSCGSDFSGYVAAHEIGHWLGLYHTTEATGDQFDPLPDTGTCPCQSCGYRTCDASTRMMAGACTGAGTACAGGDDLMFWIVDPSISVGLLSPQQGLVMRSNPAVK